MDNIFLQLIINGIEIGSIYALIASGFSIVFNIQKFINIAHGGIYILSAFLAYYFIKILGTSYIIGILSSIICCNIIGYLIDTFVYEKLKNTSQRSLSLLILSFSIFIFIQSIILLSFGGNVYSYGIIAEIGYNFYGAYITKIQLFILFITLIVFLDLFFLLKKTWLGRSMKAIADDEIVASTIGINVTLVNEVTFLIGTTLSAIAGILISFEQNIEFNMGLMAVLKGITASIIGGMGSVLGVFLSGLILGTIESIGAFYLSSTWKDAISFGILILFLLFRPNGLFGFKSRKEIGG